MANQLVDIVNFNADASCLSSEKWLRCLEGGKQSSFYQWMMLYVKYEKKISLGLIGATIADIKLYNPESIDLINNNQDIFELLFRPWSHDIGIYRQDNAFIFNVQMGIEIIKREFENIANFFLPPEFMINSKQIELLNSLNINSIFINPNRYDEQTALRIPRIPYKVLATSNVIANCISIEGSSTKAYLKSMQLYDDSIWNDSVFENKNDILYSWRDGESVFLMPEGIEREEFWLKSEDKGIKRNFLDDLDIEYIENNDLKNPFYKTYPVHSFLAWMQEMKMLWYVEKISDIEKEFDNLSLEKKIIFLQLINSDILASVEKQSLTVNIVINNKTEKFIIYRQEKGFEGEEFLSLYNGSEIKKNSAYMKKFKARQIYLNEQNQI